jgi:hypothetical protein
MLNRHGTAPGSIDSGPGHAGLLVSMHARMMTYGSPEERMA